MVRKFRQTAKGICSAWGLGPLDLADASPPGLPQTVRFGLPELHFCWVFPSQGQWLVGRQGGTSPNPRNLSDRRNPPLDSPESNGS